MGDFFKFLTDAGVAGFFIMGLAAFAIVLIIDRTRALFFEYSMKVDPFMDQIKGLIENGKVDEAITFCGANSQKPLAHVIKKILERSDRDEQSIQTALEVSVSEVVPKMSKRLGYLVMVSNVATLVGLLGTIQGLIMSFEAVSFADPSQKQTILSQGISMAMNTTAMGLYVAIPVMVVYAFLHAKQNRLFSEIDENSGKVIDLLKSVAYQPFSENSAFPNEIGNVTKLEKKENLPPPKAKAA